jgi:hypothetical protein
MKKVGRNDPCPCGSGKKFKKCCESSMLGGKFKASKVDALDAPKVTRLTGLFKSQMATIAVPSGKAIQMAHKAESIVPETPLHDGEKTDSSSEGLEQKGDI